ncbi:hypothetical protein ZOSMA_28G00070 [Zostera marina]|uniref:SBP-type domain-containing protein n=1 Tax=Zostera marina TaxID=29655 RepID=A0A0K9PCG4_ZOSMR|nr:hypothetical protein ZOSMA_28G00070 [Zostera marina]
MEEGDVVEIGLMTTGVVRTNKILRSESPTRSNEYPSCQVDNCKVNLTAAKEYHRRHKVCEAHSKAPEILVEKQKQRFCQQCSRFHLISEFDEGKRSCRRRLADHNLRRRKIQPEDALLSSSSSSYILPSIYYLQGNRMNPPTIINPPFPSPIARDQLVENGLRGNSLLVIIADENICRELRELELDFEDTGNENSIVHFLNELGWLFQRTKSPQLYSFRSKQSYQGFLKHKIGLNSWNTLLDSNGRTPFACAESENNHKSYNEVVAKKIANKENSQYSISIVDSSKEKTGQ